MLNRVLKSVLLAGKSMVLWRLIRLELAEENVSSLSGLPRRLRRDEAQLSRPGQFR